MQTARTKRELQNARAAHKRNRRPRPIPPLAPRDDVAKCVVAEREGCVELMKEELEKGRKKIVHCANHTTRYSVRAEFFLFFQLASGATQSFMSLQVVSLIEKQNDFANAHYFIVPAGNSMVNVVPLPSSLCTSIVPLCA